MQDGNPAVIGNPFRPVALRPLLSKGVPLLKPAQGAAQGCNFLCIESRFEDMAPRSRRAGVYSISSHDRLSLVAQVMMPTML